MSADKETAVREELIGEQYLPFGCKTLYAPALLKNQLSIRTSGKNPAKGWKSVPISNTLKNIVLDIIFKNKFEAKKYDEMTVEEQKLFDKLCLSAKLQTQAVARHYNASCRERDELFKKFEVLKGELLAGNNSAELVKKLRNLVHELAEKEYIQKPYYHKLMQQIIDCL